MNLPPELFLIAMFVLMYFLLIRPQQKRAKDHKNLLKELKKGDEIVGNQTRVKVVKNKVSPPFR